MDDKLLVLADDMTNYVKALLIKYKKSAQEAGHNMSLDIMEEGGDHSPNAGAPYLYTDYHSYCNKCKFSLTVHHYTVPNNEHKITVEYSDAELKDKCPAQ